MATLTASTARPPPAEAEDGAARVAKALDALAPRLPADSHVRLACAHPSFRASEPLRKSYLHLDVSRGSGVAVEVTDEVLHSMAALAHGRLEMLDIRGCARVSHDAALSTIIANRATLREVRINDDTSEFVGEGITLTGTELATLLASLPQLCALDAVAVEGSTAAAVALLRDLALQQGALRLTRVHIEQSRLARRRDLNMLQLFACVAAATGYPPSEHTGEPARIVVRTDNAEEASLHITAGVRLNDVAPWVEIVQALVAHPTLRELSLARMPSGEMLAEAVGALISADAPALRTLNAMHMEDLFAALVRPLFEALPRNTHLEVLELGAWLINKLGDDFLRYGLLPAVGANSSLRKLCFWFSEQELPPSLREAEAMVAARAGSA